MGKERAIMINQRADSYYKDFATVLVCGGRDYKDRKAVFNFLDNLQNIAMIVSGGARGADTLAVEWAGLNNCPAIIYEPRWNLYGKAAGPIRNQAMLDNESIDLVVAFPGGKGTADMVRRAAAAGVKVVQPVT
jgi:hypothetical protein